MRPPICCQPKFVLVVCRLFACHRDSVDKESYGEEGRLTIYEHITRSARERRSNAIELARELHLATETRGLSKAERHVKHVIFVVLTLTAVSAEQGPNVGRTDLRFGEEVKVFWGQDNVAG